MRSIRHSVCRWCYQDIPLEDLCIASKEMGISSVELVMPDDMPVIAKHGLECAMISFPTATTPDGTLVGRIEKAFNRIEHHDTLIAIYEPHLKAAANAGAKQVICFPGNREGMRSMPLRSCFTQPSCRRSSRPGIRALSVKNLSQPVRTHSPASRKAFRSARSDAYLHLHLGALVTTRFFRA